MIYLFTLVTTAVDLVALVALEATTAENASLDESAEASMESIGRGVTIDRSFRFDRSFRSVVSVGRFGGFEKSSGWNDDVRSRGKVGCVCVNRVYYYASSSSS